MNITCDISLGELIDKISILKIKLEKISDSDKLIHIKKELNTLSIILRGFNLGDHILTELDELKEVNLKLWQIEDDIRDKEYNLDFGENFIKLARSVYICNDSRFEIKNRINTRYGSEICEVKSYSDYHTEK